MEWEYFVYYFLDFLKQIAIFDQQLNFFLAIFEYIF